MTEAEKLAALSEAELLPCPFCGSPPHEVRERGPTREHYVTIECGSCGAAICIDESGLEDDEPRAADMWNTRANQLVLIGPDAVGKVARAIASTSADTWEYLHVSTDPKDWEFEARAALAALGVK